MWSTIFSQLLVATALILLVVATATRDWQILGMEKPKVHTNIGLWQTCSKSEDKLTACYSTKTGSSHKYALYAVRSLSIISLFVVCAGLLLTTRPISLTLIGIAVLLTGLVLFLYSSQLENYFSQYFDSLMYSRYGYSYYLQASATALLLVALVAGCSKH